MDTTLPIFLSLTQDLIFKNYFKLHKEALKSLLKAFLPLPKNSFIQKVTILDSLLPSLSQEEKSSIMDLRLQLQNGELVNVEMQAFPHACFTERILFYWAKNYSSQLKAGQEYHTLCPVYSLVFSTFDLFSKTNSFYMSFSLRADTSPHFYFTEDMCVVTVELNKFRKQEIGSLIDLREEWCYLLKESHKMGERESKELSSKDPEMESAMSYLRKFSRNEQFQILEEAREKNRRDQVAREHDKFHAGRMQRQTELILNMLEKKADISFISEVTGLSEEEINELRKGEGISSL